MTDNNSNQKMIVEVYTQTSIKQLTDALNVPPGMMMVEGVLARVDSENRNKRFYERSEYQKHIDLMSQRIQESNGILGELEHPKSMNINLNNASHKVMSIRLDEDGYVRGTILLLDTPKGMICQSVVRSGSPLPISSRAVGKVQENGSVKLDFMSTFDVVGIAGFKEAALKQSQRVSESFNEDGQLISEMYEYDINENGDAIDAAPIQSIVESVKAALLAEHFVPIDEVNKLVEAKFEELKATLVINESAESNVISEEDIVSLMNDRFTNVYSPILESWVTEQFAPENGRIIQEWFANDYANVIESWIKDDVLPANAAITESWIKNEFAPENGKIIQEWLQNDFAPENGRIIQEWLQNEFVKSSVLSEEAVDEKVTIVAEEQNDETVVEKTSVESINEAALIFKSKLLNEVDSLINEAKNIEVPTSQPSQRVDETNFIGAPTWLKLIPQEHKVLWQSMNESQKEQIYRKASIRHLVTESEIERFWKQVDYNTLMNPSVIKRQITETVNEVAVDPRKAAIIAEAKQLQKRN